MKDWTGNSNSIYKTLGASNHTDKEREERDFYATSPVAIDKLLMVETPSHNVWECATGNGDLAQRLKDKGFNVLCSDIIKRDYKLDFTADFLELTKEDINSRFSDFDILTNPPYSNAKEFVLHSLDLVPDGHKVYMFLKLTFLEGKARYKELFSKYPPKKIYVFSERVMCAKNGEFEKMKEGGGSAVAYGWFVWEKNWNGKPTVEWI